MTEINADFVSELVHKNDYKGFIMILNGIDISEDYIKNFSKKWKIREFSIFGSILRNDFFGP